MRVEVHGSMKLWFMAIILKFGFELDWSGFQSLVTICDFGRWGVVIVGGCGCGCGCVNGLAWIEKKVVGFFRERERHR